MKSIRTLLVILIVSAIGLGIAYLAGMGDERVMGHSVIFVCALVAFGVNWLVFIPSALARTEKFYDLTGSITYLSVILVAAELSKPLDLRAAIVAVLVAIWAVRLGGFLFLRIQKDGKDRRFDEIKQDRLRFLVTWTLQGLWVTLTAACALMIISNETRVEPDIFFYAGLALWVIGFGLEVVADSQKSAFRKNKDNAERFITSGLWGWSRHPNYVGEIVLWLGVAVMAVPVLSGWQWVVMISPVFVCLLLTRVSGVPLLEKRAQEKWGDDPAYQAYRAKTPELFPFGGSGKPDE
jgi:steroid 5-alpha reductase family enzyme